MEVLDRGAAVSPDGRAVVFILSTRGRDVECAIARDALEEHFWLPRDADAARAIKTFESGRTASSRSPRGSCLRGQTNRCV
jgi:hypothetical protein